MSRRPQRCAGARRAVAPARRASVPHHAGRATQPRTRCQSNPGPPTRSSSACQFHPEGGVAGPVGVLPESHQPGLFQCEHCQDVVELIGSDLPVSRICESQASPRHPPWPRNHSTRPWKSAPVGRVVVVDECATIPGPEVEGEQAQAAPDPPGRHRSSRSRPHVPAVLGQHDVLQLPRGSLQNDAPHVARRQAPRGTRRPLSRRVTGFDLPPLPMRLLSTNHCAAERGSISTLVTRAALDNRCSAGG